MQLSKQLIKPVRLIIFNKDTLLNSNKMWSDWIEKLSTKLFKDNVYKKEKLYRELGYHSHFQYVVPSSLLEEGDMNKIFDRTYQVVKSFDVPAGLVFTHWHTTPKREEPVCNLPELFSYLKNNNNKIAVLTNDTKQYTTTFLKKYNLLDLVDASLCKDDTVYSNINNICDQVNIDPKDTIMVVNSLQDIELSKASNVQYTIGVQNNSYNQKYNHNCDIIIYNISELKNILKFLIYL